MKFIGYVATIIGLILFGVVVAKFGLWDKLVDLISNTLNK